MGNFEGKRTKIAASSLNSWEIDDYGGNLKSRVLAE